MTTRPIDTSHIFAPGPIRSAYRMVQPIVEHALGLSSLWKVYDRVQADSPDVASFARNSLRELGVQISFDPALLKALEQARGPLLICANHPFGGLEFIALTLALEEARPGEWKFLGNEIVCSVPELRPRLIPVTPFGERTSRSRENRTAITEALQYLKGGGILGLFPAGRVSFNHDGFKTVCDGPWTPHAPRLAARTGASILTIAIPGRNSRFFLSIPNAWRQARAMMLAREMMHPVERTVRLMLASAYTPQETTRLYRKAARPADRLRADVYVHMDVERCAHSSKKSANKESHLSVPVDDSIPRESTLEEVARVRDTARVTEHGDFDLLLARGDCIPALLQDLGARRELTFRLAGQGTEQARDVSPEDAYYHHLILWDRIAGQIAGAYRVGIVREILAEHGAAGLYLDHIFDIHPDFYLQVGSSFELSRSFVMPDYQRDNRALAGLWKGLASAAIKYDAHTFFGSVTISNAHHPVSRSLLVAFLQRQYADDPDFTRRVRARTPFAHTTNYHELVADAYADATIDALEPIVRRIEHEERGIPPLMRYYCALGAKYSAYHVEPTFQDALYCLLRVDLETIPAAYKRRFLGSQVNRAQ